MITKPIQFNVRRRLGNTPCKNKIAQMLAASSLFPRCELAAIKMIAVDAHVLIAVELIAAHDRSGPKSIAASTQRAHVLAALPTASKPRSFICRRDISV